MLISQINGAVAACPAKGGKWSKMYLSPPWRGKLLKRYDTIIHMAFVYILQNIDTSRYYIGSCIDIDKRVRRHQLHTGGRTTHKGNWKFICFKQCNSISDARILEKKIKSYKGGNAFKKIINGAVSEWSNVPLC